MLRRVKVKIYKMDQFYSINLLELIARMELNSGKRLYVKVDKMNCVIFICRDVNLFMNLVLPAKDSIYKRLVHDSLAEDGVHVEEMEKDSRLLRLYEKRVPTLKLLCCDIVHWTVDRDLRMEMLPKMLTDTLDDFSKLAEARYEYEKLKWTDDPMLEEDEWTDEGEWWTDEEEEEEMKYSAL